MATALTWMVMAILFSGMVLTARFHRHDGLRCEAAGRRAGRAKERGAKVADSTKQPTPRSPLLVLKLFPGLCRIDSRGRVSLVKI